MLKFLDQLGEIAILTRDFFRYLFRRPFEGRLIVEQLDSIGVGSLNIVNLTAIFTGMVLALQSSVQLKTFGASMYIGNLVSASMIRELGPVLAGLMVAGPGLFSVHEELECLAEGHGAKRLYRKARPNALLRALKFVK